MFYPVLGRQKILPSLCQATKLRIYSRMSFPMIPASSPRFFQSTSRRGAFTNILADENAPPVQISSISEEAITLVDGLKIPGPCIFLEGRVFLWDVPAVGGTPKNAWKGWTEDHLEIFDTVIPAPEILLFGTGRRIVQPPSFIQAYLNKRGIQMDVLDTRNACSTYNLLSEEGRRVAAALLPISQRTWQKSTIPSKPSQ